MRAASPIREAPPAVDLTEAVTQVEIRPAVGAGDRLVEGDRMAAQPIDVRNGLGRIVKRS